MGQLWAEGRSTLQLHQQTLTPDVKVFLKNSVVLPPDSEIVTPVSIWSVSGVRPAPCSLVEPSGSCIRGRLSSGVGCFGGSCGLGPAG